MKPTQWLSHLRTLFTKKSKDSGKKAYAQAQTPYLDFIQALTREFNPDTDILIIPNGFQVNLQAVADLVQDRYIIMPNVKRVSIIRAGAGKIPGELPMF